MLRLQLSIVRNSCLRSRRTFYCGSGDIPLTSALIKQSLLPIHKSVDASWTGLTCLQNLHVSQRAKLVWGNAHKNNFHTCQTSREKSSEKGKNLEIDRFPGYTPVFRFPYIIPMHVMCRFKIYQTAFTAFLVPVSLLSFATGQAEIFHVALISGVCGLATSMLVLAGEIFRRTVGFIYIREEKDEVIISHLGWWGDRQDFRVELSDIVPPEEYNEDINEAVWKIKFYGSKDFFFISTQFGGIVDKQNFELIFGKPKKE